MCKLNDQQLIEELQKRFLQNKQTLNELKQTTEKLYAVNKKLEASEAMKSHFISNITNEIINPFSSILGLTEHLANMGKEDYDKMKQFAKMIHEEAFDLDFQLKNIFAAAKLEAGEYTPGISLVDVVTLFNNTIDAYKNTSSKKNVTVKLDYKNNSTIREKEFFKTDPDKLNLIVSNLINNSIRFSPENSEIKIYLTLNDDFIHFTVHDNGMGIEKNQVNKIFDRFYRTDNSINSENKGLGLGLSITKGILEMMGGNISVKDSDKGSEFQVTLPEDRTNEMVDNMSTSGNEFFFDEENQIF